MCTAVSLMSKQNEVFLGRTLDFYHDFDLEVCIVPRNYEWRSIVSTQLYQNQYSFIATGDRKQGDFFADGANEKGLGVAALFFPGYASFIKKEYKKSSSISCIELVTYLLGNCASVDEVLEVVPSLHLIEEEDPITFSTSALHWIVTDKTGKAITIEQTSEKLYTLDNPIGVLTNSPDFSWHLTNLRNYSHISPQQLDAVKWNPLTLTPFGQGAGTFGLPGDFTSPSRFVRIAFSKNFFEVPDSREEMVLACFHLMETVSIPKGLVVTNNDSCNYTQFTIFMNLNTGDYYFNTYANNGIKQANIHDVDSSEIVSLGKLKCSVQIEHI